MIPNTLPSTKERLSDLESTFETTTKSLEFESSNTSLTRCRSVDNSETDDSAIMIVFDFEMIFVELYELSYVNTQSVNVSESITETDSL